MSLFNNNVGKSVRTLTESTKFSKVFRYCAIQFIAVDSEVSKLL